MSSNTDIALGFFAAMNSVTKEYPNKESVLSFFTDETIFDNIPMDRIVGAEGIWGLLDLGAETVEWVVHNIAETAEGSATCGRHQVNVSPIKVDTLI